MFSPLAKSMHQSEPIHDLIHDRRSFQRSIERRFRFLAATAEDMLHKQWPTYRQTLLAIRTRTGAECSPQLDTVDLETEIFLHLLSEHAEYIQVYRHRPAALDVDAIAASGDGMTDVLVHSRPSRWKNAVTSLRFGSKDIIPAIAKLATTFAVTRLHYSAAQRLSRLILHRASHHRAIASLTTNTVTSSITAQAAKESLMNAVAKYSALRQIFSFVGPLLWLTTAMDLAKISLGTDYARLAKTVFMLAQIRLVRTRGWTAGGDEKK